jgi:RHS repeat-associated protein
MTSFPGGFTPTYDANGNVLNDGTHTYTWDAEGRPVTVDGVGLTFDALLRMVEQNRSGAYTEIVYAPTGEKLALMNGQSLVKAFVPLPGSSTAVYTSTGLSYYRHPDWLGSNRLTSSPSRAALSTIAYGPFGETYAPFGASDPSFTGQNQDTSAGDYDFLFREYSTQGRWPSPDPAGLAAVDFSDPRSLNRYAYVLNDPLRFVDPLGLDGCWTKTVRDMDGNVLSVSGWCDLSFHASISLSELLTGGGGGRRTWPCFGFAGTGCGGPRTPPPPSTFDSRAAALANALNGIGLQSLNPDVCGGGYFVLRGAQRELGAAHYGAYVLVTHDSRSGTSVGYLVEGGGGPVSVGREGSLNPSSGQVDSNNLILVGVGDHLGAFAGYSNRNSPIQLGGFAAAFGRGVGGYVNLVPGGSCHP